MQTQLSKSLQTKLEKLLENVGDMSLKRRARRIIEEINPKKDEKILDLGCGTGYYLFLLSNLPISLNLTGLDNDKKALDEAKTTLKKRKIEFVLGDSHTLPFKDNTFDKVVASEVLEHLVDDERALREIFRILKPNGIIIISVPSINYPFFWDPINWILQRLFNMHIKRGFFSGIWNDHLRLYRLQDIRKKFEKAKFKVLSSEELTFWCLPFNHYLVNLVARLLYDIKIVPQVADMISKFKEIKKPFILNLAFKFVNFVDKVNEIFPQKSGVSILVSAAKINSVVDKKQKTRI